MHGRITFGPVPSRRLGRSLGINNIPPKACSYACVYCQVGATGRHEVDRRSFYEPEEILRQVSSRLDALKQQGEQVDWLSFVPDGEPTLDIHLGETIDLLRPLGLPIAVISNASLVWRRDVQSELAKADWLSLKVDAVDPAIWRRVNGPDPRLDLPLILDGIRAMAEVFQGTLTTETLLVAGRNDAAEAVGAVAEFLAEVNPSVAYLAAPTRPPADRRVRPPEAESLTRAFELMSARLPRVEYLISYEGDSFACTGKVEDDVLAIAAVHPLREDALRGLLAKAGAGWGVVEGLISSGGLRTVEYEGHRFYLRVLRAH